MLLCKQLLLEWLSFSEASSCSFFYWISKIICTGIWTINYFLITATSHQELTILLPLIFSLDMHCFSSLQNKVTKAMRYSIKFAKHKTWCQRLDPKHNLQNCFASSGISLKSLQLMAENCSFTSPKRRQQKLKPAQIKMSQTNQFFFAFHSISALFLHAF